jgi:hypothetical protein
MVETTVKGGITGDLLWAGSFNRCRELRAECFELADGGHEIADTES